MNSNCLLGCLAGAAFTLLNLSSLAQNIPPPGGNGTNLTVIPDGAVWRYLDNGADPGQAWRAPNFDDSPWAAGPAQLGYGDGDEATVVSFGPDSAQKYVTTYFRRTFDLPDAGHVTQLVVRLLRDDGAVVYLNGQEVVRDNLPAGPISSQTLALSSTGPDENQFHDFVLGPSFLVNGRNVVAVEVHQVNVTSTDLGFDLELTAVFSPGETLPVVSIQATVPETIEPSPNTRVQPGEFTITRSGNTNEQLILFVEMTGTAAFGQDYQSFPQFMLMAPGATTLKFLVGPLDDSLVEGDETVIATLVEPPIDSLPNYRIDPEHNEARVVIHDNDIAGPPLVAFTAAFDTSECPPGRACDIACGGFVLTRTGPRLDEPLTVFLNYQGSATPDVDYRSLPESATFAAGESSMRLGVCALDDCLVEGVEDVVASLQPDPSLGPIERYRVDPERSTARMIITDGVSDALPAVSIVGAHGTLEFCPPNADCPDLGFTVKRQGPGLDRPLTVRLRYGGTATAGMDYQALPETLTFEPGQERVTAHSVPIDDTVVEGDETIIAQLVCPSAASGDLYQVVETNSSATMILYDNDRPPDPRSVVRIEATQRLAEESSFPLRRLPLRGEFTISRTGPTNDSLTVFVHHSGIATPGADYPHLPLLVSIPAGATSTRIEVVPIDDGVPEGIETIVAMLSHCPPDTDPPMGIPCFLGYEIDPAFDRATVFIRDDGITQASLAIINPNDGASFTVGDTILIEAVAIDLEGYLSRVEFWDGEQMVGVSEVVFIRAPDPGTPIYHSIEWRDAAPGRHALTARVIGVDGAVLMSPPVHLTVGAVVDRVVLEIEATDATAAEAGENGAPDPAVFTIRRVAGPQDLEMPVFYSVDGTAQSGADYSELSGRILLPGGAESVRLVVNPVPDKALEGDETVIIRLEPPICIAIFPPPPECYEIGSNGVARAVIRDSAANEPPQVAITQPPSGTEFPPDTDVEIVAETRDPDGYVPKVEFLADGRKIGEASVEFIHPPDPGQPQTFTFVWHQPTPGSHALTARATDNDGDTATSAPVEIKVAMSEPLPIVTVAAPDPFAVEPGSNTNLNTATFRIRRFGPTNEALVVAYSLHGTADNGSDYELLSGLAILPAGRRSETVIVRPLADNLREGIETVRLRLEEPPPTSAEIRVINPYRVGQRRVAVALISDGPLSHSPGWAHCFALPGSLMHLCFAAEPGHNYRVEASSDCRNWETLFDGVSSDGSWQFIDTDMENHPQRFYRLTPEPVAEVDE